jgi:hypothetical protein
LGILLLALLVPGAVTAEPSFRSSAVVVRVKDATGVPVVGAQVEIVGHPEAGPAADAQDRLASSTGA